MYTIKRIRRTNSIHLEILKGKGCYMGTKDVATKKYMSDNVRFADVFNYAIYGGRQIIRHDMLKEISAEELLLMKGENEKLITGDRVRDLEKMCVIKKSGNIVYMLLGIENASNVHYAQPVRNGLYDFMGYADQVERKSRENRRKRNLSGSSEFLSGLKKEDRIAGIITLTVYFGDRPWDGPRSLHEMLSIDDKEILKLIPDYRINLIDPHEINNSEKFMSDFRYIVEFMKASGDKEKMSSLLSEKHDEYSNMERDAMVLIRECANINIKVEEKEEKQDMCKAIDDMMKDAREEEHKAMQEKLDEKQNQLDEKQSRLDKYEKEIEELKKQLAERQTA